jgi:hypothetical protein
LARLMGKKKSGRGASAPASSFGSTAVLVSVFAVAIGAVAWLVGVLGAPPHASRPAGHTGPWRECERRAADNLSLRQFYDEFARPRRPVVVTGLAPVMVPGYHDTAGALLDGNETAARLAAQCGGHGERVALYEKEAAGWAGMEKQREQAGVSDYMSGWAAATFHAAGAWVYQGQYLFDYTLGFGCPALMAELALPRYVANDFFQQAAEDHLPAGSMCGPGACWIGRADLMSVVPLTESWPSLLVSDGTSHSALHRDTSATHFWMLMLSGRKLWTIVDPADAKLLGPKGHVFQAAAFDEQAYRRFPKARDAGVTQCEIGPGDWLYIPGDAPHGVRNLGPTAAIAGNYVDAANAERAAASLEAALRVRENSLQAELAKGLRRLQRQPGGLEAAMDWELPLVTPFEAFKQRHRAHPFSQTAGAAAALDTALAAAAARGAAVLLHFGSNPPICGPCRALHEALTDPLGASALAAALEEYEVVGVNVRVPANGALCERFGSREVSHAFLDETQPQWTACGEQWALVILEPSVGGGAPAVADTAPGSSFVNAKWSVNTDRLLTFVE